MATHGRLSDFDGANEDWESYVERLEMYFTANDVEDPVKQRAIFLSACGAATYRMVKSLLAPKKPTEVEFKEIVKQMTAHYHPTPERRYNGSSFTPVPASPENQWPHMFRS